jgi:hypothetical protein
MGGYGSGRYGGRPTVESAVRLDIDSMMHWGAIQPGFHLGGEMRLNQLCCSKGRARRGRSASHRSKMNYRDLPTSDLIARLRHAAAIWFKNDDLLLVEELIHATSAATRRPLHTAS